VGGLREALVLGIDPGTRVVGYGAVEVTAAGPRCVSAGVLKPRLTLSVPERLGQIGAGLERLLHELQPGVVVIEEAFAARNIQSALRIGEGRGVALACAARLGAKIVQVPPAVAKKALVGHGAADKTQVAAMVARVLCLQRPPEPLDVTDALALALTYVTRPTALETRT
jgi:crossover junction endodeoxyribonuclease RuvC